MSASYKVVTVHRTVYVHGVDVVEVDGELDPGQLVFRRAYGLDVKFPLVNVISYEVSRAGAAR